MATSAAFKFGKDVTSDISLPNILLYFDEAEITTETMVDDSSEYLQRDKSLGPYQPRTVYSALTRAIECLKSQPLIALFTSTSSQLYKLAPPRSMHSSERVLRSMHSSGRVLRSIPETPMPFLELPYDVLKTRVVPGTLSLEEITETKHLVQFGRLL